MSIISTLKFIKNHELASKNKKQAFKNFFKWQVSQLLHKRPILLPFVNESQLLVEKGMTGATGNIYCGLHEFEDMAFLLHFLRSDDTFFDIGANVGSYTILAGKNCKASCFSFEPSTTTFDKLSNNVFLNRINETTHLFNLGVSSTTETLYFSKGLDTINHVISNQSEETIEIKTTSIDEIAKKFEVIPTMMKIDVEGFEFKVIEGAKSTLSNTNLKAIIIELNGSGKRYGFDENEIHSILVNYGFKPYSYHPFEKELHLLKDKNIVGNTIYLRDYDFIKSRITYAPSNRILDIIF